MGNSSIVCRLGPSSKECPGWSRDRPVRTARVSKRTLPEGTLSDQLPLRLLTRAVLNRRAYDGGVSEEAYLEATINGEMRRFPLPPDRACSIGRSEKNTVVVDDDEASRNH